MAKQSGTDHPKNRKTNVRFLAMQALLHIEQGGAYSNLMLNQLLERHPDLDQRDKRLLTEIVYGTIQYKMKIDNELHPFLKKGIDQLDDWVKQLLRLSFYQLIFLDRVPERAVVHEAVEIAKRKGHKGISGMVNGVLRQYLRTGSKAKQKIRDPVQQLAIETSHPKWLVKRWLEQYGWEQTKNICTENNIAPKTTIRVNRLKTDRQTLQKQMQDMGICTEPTKESRDGLLVISGGNVTHNKLFRAGYYTIQDESSMFIPYLLDPQPGMKVLDACAAPGGKTTHLAEYMNNEGQIIAVDLHPHKEKLVKQNVERLGIDIVQTRVQDARKLKLADEEKFDRILLDAPCSGFGVIRRKPDLKWKKTQEDIASIAEIQYEILEKMAALLKRDGALVYSTCTLEREENQQVVGRFIHHHPQFEIVQGSEKQILPHHFGSDGFYMIKIKRKSGD